MSAKKPAKRTAPKRRLGAPSTFTQAAADLLCDRIATSRKSITRICTEEPALPNVTTVLRWLAGNESFRIQYARAKELQTEVIEQEMLEIADETGRDTIGGDNGPQPNSEWIARSRLRVDTRKWLMSKLAPKKYGEKLEIGGDIGVTHAHLTLDQLRKRMATAKAGLPPENDERGA